MSDFNYKISSRINLWSYPDYIHKHEISELKYFDWPSVCHENVFAASSIAQTEEQAINNILRTFTFIFQQDSNFSLPASETSFEIRKNFLKSLLINKSQQKPYIYNDGI